MQLLLEKKTNWQEFSDFFRQKNITSLYHFTDRDNIDSIKRNKGLYSWDYCDKSNIQIPVSGGDQNSRIYDRRYGLQDYVRLSFVKDHPMKFVALRDNRINNAVVLEISIETCYFVNTLFANMNAADSKHTNSKGFSNNDTLDFIKTKVHFDLFRCRYNDLIDMDRKYYQAEILVKTWIPIEYITNINNF